MVKKKLEDSIRLSVVVSQEYLKHIKLLSCETGIREKNTISVSELIRRAIDRWLGYEKPIEVNLDNKTTEVENGDIFGYIYVAEDEENVCKIGVSKNFPDKRVKNLTTKYHKDFKLVGYLRCTYPYDLEKALFYKLGAYRIKGEWFLLSYEQIKKLTKLNFTDVY